MTPEALARSAALIQQYRYVWPASSDAESTRRNRAGTCAGKHAVLAEDLASCGLIANPMFVVGPLVPELWPDLRELAGHLLEVHECLSVETPWAGPLIADVTWHPEAIAGGLPGTLDWDGVSSMTVAVQPFQSYAVSRTHLRAQKEALRARLYSPEDRALRDATMTEIAWRAASVG
jgi:hypothetical protein